MTNQFDARKRVVDRIKKTNFDILVIGGGITGAGIARDAALRGYKTLLLEKDDFGFGTSSGSSKLIHAGLRYIANGEFGLVRAASVERKRLVNMTPNLSEPLRFIIPCHKDTLTKFKARLAVWIYDFLALFRNFGFHKIYNKKQAKSLLPDPIREENFQGGASYFDASMDDARITLEVLLSAEEAGATILNYCEADKIITAGNQGQEQIKVYAKDKILDETIEVNGNVVVSATGVWSDDLLKSIKDYNKEEKIRPTKGIHLITERFYEEDNAIVVPVKDGRIIFVLPFGKYHIIGTTDTDYNDDLDHVPVTTEDVKYLIDAVNYIFPQALHKDMIVSAYSGLRPLIKPPESKSESKVSRKHEIEQIKPNIWFIAGGKYTTYREMAEELVNQIEHVEFNENRPCKTANTPIWGWNKLQRKEWQTWVETKKQELKTLELSEDVQDHLMRYGIKVDTIIDLIKKNPKLKERLTPDRTVILAEIDYTVFYEKTWHVTDFMLRRTQLQLSKDQGLDCVDVVAKRMAELLDWSKEKIDKELKTYRNALVWRKKQ